MSKVLEIHPMPSEMGQTQLEHLPKLLKEVKQPRMYVGEEYIYIVLPKQEIVLEVDLYWDDTGTTLYSTTEFLQKLEKDLETVRSWEKEGK